ncbi:DEAD/DEAH box helicase family protein [Aliidiomarina haloalkalitolerans]|uniref:DEAD/DEAH box helicase n=1 Tax=Aliidiomarina haloalkalitolerans TaxID=859059 RepID=A0A432VUG7_9GAMM|nr:DEAD/DEAH box helicase family protein [Aliidiomarina haloalkalitolerans]RUO20159.1 DEAD/DEAH box helicase [Aliidiomarina haloalkalitolerans]
MGLAQGYLLTTGTSKDPLLPKLIRAINHATAIDICVSFAQPSGVSLLLEPLIDAIGNNAVIRIMTSDYLSITHPQALRQLLLLQQRGAQVKLYQCSDRKAFHLKSYIFVRERETVPNHTIEAGTAFVGSSNLSASALTSGLEWNLRFDLEPSSDKSIEEFAHIRRSFETIFESPEAHFLTRQLIESYTKQFEEIARQNAPLMTVLGIEDEPEPEAHTPNSSQTEALIALQESRNAGYCRGLVVMATGMGKTWLAAFDAQQIKASRVLFVAHREEILLQAQRTFSALFPEKSIGFFNGVTKDTEAEFLFASVQSLGKLEYLHSFAVDHFDYVVVDEFHHATAQGYQKLLAYFKPKFLLGLTATPERTDQSDILSLCDNNLVFERNIVHGIESKILVPFHYYGIHDEFVDYKEIPWRNGKFDPTALDVAFATQKRAKHIYENWLSHKQSRTLAFCISKRHADYMANYFCKQGVKAVAVYSGSEVRRNEALAELSEGKIDVVFSVDLFNEGTDIPAVDTVLMTRPTESKILFLQQLGRGLRASPDTGKSHVVVIDFIGNHKSFLIKPAGLLGVVGLRASAKRVINNQIELAPGCHLNFDTGIVDFWKELIEVMGSTLEDDYDELKTELGHRPTATEFFHSGNYQRPKIKSRFGGWLGMVAKLENDKNLLTLNNRHGAFMRQAIESTSMTKCFKAILLRSFIELDGFELIDGAMKGVDITELSIRSWEILHRYPKAVAVDLAHKERSLSAESAEWLKYWLKNPIAAYSSKNKSDDQAWFLNDGVRMSPSFIVGDDERDMFEAIALELCDYRMAEYLSGK